MDVAEATDCVGQHDKGGDSIVTPGGQCFGMVFKLESSVEVYSQPFNCGCWGYSSGYSIVVEESDGW